MFNLEKYFCKHSFYEKSRHYEQSMYEKGLRINLNESIQSAAMQEYLTGKTKIILCCEKCGIYKIYNENGKLI